MVITKQRQKGSRVKSFDPCPLFTLRSGSGPVVPAGFARSPHDGSATNTEEATVRMHDGSAFVLRVKFRYTPGSTGSVPAGGERKVTGRTTYDLCLNGTYL